MKYISDRLLVLFIDVLLVLFYEQKKLDFQLGISEFKLAIKAVVNAIGTKSKEDFSLMCQTLLAKSIEEQQQISEVLDRILSRNLISSDVDKTFDDKIDTPNLSQESKYTRDTTVTGKTSETSKVKIQLQFGIGSTKATVDVQIPVFQDLQINPHIDMIGSLPISKRQMKRAWRYYRKMLRSGPRTELDIMATIEQMYRHGLLSKPIFIPRRTNQAIMLMLIDEGGSMVPFKRIIKNLILSVQQAGLSKARTYFFHDVPEKYLYKDSNLMETIPIEVISRSLNECGVLIVSDAGAARGNLDEYRSKITIEFLKQLKNFTHNIAWLNPMPISRWKGTTAHLIQDLCKIPMFELNRSGLDAAVNVLRGKAN